ncbi:MAG: sulfatase-like hydrolase/transferase [Planctomycetota bacterium]
MDKVRFAMLFSVCLLWFGSGCERSGNPGRREAASKAQAAGCNVILITMDTTRADRIGCYGWKNAATPSLDGLARRGVRFDQAYAQTPITLPSHATLLTGTCPPEHGVRDNGRYKLDLELPTLAESFRQHGYRTGAFIAAEVLNVRYGLKRGFETYDDEMPRAASGHSYWDRNAAQVCERALQWLEQVKTGPFMAWVHFYDPHPPYDPPPEYLQKPGDAYDGEVAFMDVHIGKLMNWLETNALRDKTLVVAVGDHGESLGDHGYKWHALLVYDSIMRTPLIFSLPGRLPEGTTSKVLARVADVMPTILELMGWNVPAEATGESLVAALHGAERPGRVVYGESDFPYNSFGWSKLRCLITEQWKYIRAPKVELYDRTKDPGELRNVAEEHPGIVEQMEGDLAALEARMTRREGTRLTMDPQTVAALQSLGYVGTSAPPPPESASLKNPVDMLEVKHNFRAAESLLKEGKLDEAIALLEPAAERSPESFAILEKLGKAYGAVGRLEDGQRMVLQAIALYPESADCFELLATILGMRGRFQPALEAAERALSFQPDHERAPKTLAAAKAGLAQQQAEIEALRRRLEADPKEVEPRIKLSQLLVEAGLPAEAVSLLRDGLVQHPDDLGLSNALAWLLATSWKNELREGREAVRLALRVCEATGEREANYLDTLAVAYAEAGQFEHAVETGRKAVASATSAGDERSAALFQRRIKRFESGEPYHELP